MSSVRVAELLASRLCHDLVSPIGAVVNGMELIEEVGGDFSEEALELSARSARQASQRLQFYRVAFGWGGGRTDKNLADTRRLIEGVLEHGRVSMVWDTSPALDGHQPDRTVVKLVLGLVALGQEALPRGGTIHVCVAQDAPRFDITIRAEGAVARLETAHLAAIATDADPELLDTRTVTAYLTGRLVADQNGSIDVVQRDGELTLKTSFSDQQHVDA